MSRGHTDPSGTPRQPRSEPVEDFPTLLRELLVIVNQLKLAAGNLGNLSTIPQEHVPAALVVGEVTRELDDWYNRLDRWHVDSAAGTP
jgi:hypothetical protein